MTHNFNLTYVAQRNSHMCAPRDRYKNDHGSPSSYSKKLGTTYMVIDWRMDKEAEV